MNRYARSALFLAALAGCGPTNVVKRYHGNAGATDAGAPDASRMEEDAGYVSQASDPSCDMTGIWLARQTNFASSVGLSTTGGNWYFFEFAQTGDDVMVTDHYDCGLGIRSAVNGRISDAAVVALSMHNIQTGRTGTMKRLGRACDLKLQRFWSVRGASESTYLPEGHFDTRDIPELQAVIAVPSKAAPEGQEDWDGDEQPGITLLLGSTGARYAVHRDWIEWFSCNGISDDHPVCKPENAGTYGIVPNVNWDRFMIRADMNNEESVLGASAPLFETPGVVDRTKNNRVLFVHLGRTRDAPRVKEYLAKGDVLARCTYLQNFLPIEDEGE